MSENAPAGLTKNNVNISNGVNVESLTVSGKTVTLTTSTLPANRDLTVTFDGVKDLDKASGSFKYNQSVNLETAIEGFVYVPAVQGGVVPATDITVSAADGTTTKTDANGYYKLPTQVGTEEVTVKAPGNYDNVDDVIVSAEKSTAHVVTMTAVNANELQVTGVAKDAKDGSTIKGAKVELQEKINGEWVTIASHDTNASGEYEFNNSSAGDDSTNRFKNIYGEDTNRLKSDGEYRIQAFKDGVVATDATKPYHIKREEFTLNPTGPVTKQAPLLKEVEKIEDLSVNLEYTDKDITDGVVKKNNGTPDTFETNSDVKFALIDESGERGCRQ